MLGHASLPGLESVHRSLPGLSSAQNTTDATIEVYIDDFQHLTRLLAQGLEVFQVGERVFEIVGLIEKITKREGPDRVMTLLGFTFDSTTIVTTRQAHVGGDGHRIGEIPIVILETTPRCSGARLAQQNTSSLLSHTSI